MRSEKGNQSQEMLPETGSESMHPEMTVSEFHAVSPPVWFQEEESGWAYSTWLTPFRQWHLCLQIPAIIDEIDFCISNSGNLPFIG